MSEPWPTALFRTAFDQYPVASVLTDENGTPILWNAAFEAMFRALAGESPAILRESLFAWMEKRGSFKISHFVAGLLGDAKVSADVESPVLSAGGEKLWFRIRLSRVLAVDSPAGSTQRILATFEDDTERKRRERLLLAAKDEAEKTTQTKSIFLANMSHEIRTPIQTILGMTELLGDTKLDKEQMDYVRTVRFSADILLGLINDILDFSKIEAGKMELERTEYNLRSIVAQAGDLLILDAHKKGLEVILETDPRIPVTLVGDPGRFRQIIVNLVKNAIKHTPAGEILVVLSPVETDGRFRLRCSVADSGTGVPGSMRPRLFTPFTQAISQVTRGGTGLGLAISKHFAELMGGRIGYAPRNSGGSVFWFEIPLTPGADARPPVYRPFSSPARILCVDDHPQARSFLSRVLQSFGLTVQTAASGEEALETLRGARREGSAFDLCLVDQEMPGMDGWRLASVIKADPELDSVRLILMVPEGGRGAEAKMKLLQWFEADVSKPVNPEELYEALTKALEEVPELEAADEEPAPLPEAKVGAGRRVLLAEDHAVNQELFTILLERLGCGVVVASDGEEAVEKGSRESFDAVLMDIFMPRLNGYDAARALRDRGFQGPIVAVTASALMGEKEKCRAAGMDDILTKPFKKADLEALLARLFAGPAPGASPTAGFGPDRSTAAPTPQTVDRSILDFPAAVDTFLGNRDTVISLLSRFAEKAEGQLAELAAAAEVRNWSEAGEIAHSIKGAAWNLSARKLGDAAKAVEDAGREGLGDRVLEGLPILREAFREFRAAAEGID